MIGFLILFLRVKSQCLDAIEELVTKGELRSLVPYLYFSGKGINEYGNYDACQGKYRYVDFQVFVKPAPASVNMGLCISNLCSTAEINKDLKAFTILFEKMAKLLMHYDLSVDVVLHETDQPKELNVYNYLVICAFSIYLTLSVMVTIKNRNINQVDELNLNQVSTIADLEESVVLSKLDIRMNYALAMQPSRSQYEMLNGIRVVAFVMCFFGDVGINMVIQSNFLQLLHYMRHLVLLVVYGCLYCVDIFLWLSGFFAVLSFQRKNCMLVVLRRVYKFTPLLIVVIMINTWFLPLFGGGPRWFYVERYSQCPNWWQNILYINNFFDDNYCAMWTWYLALDMQMFTLCAFIMVVYKRYALAGKVITGMLLVASQAFITYTCFVKKYGLPYYAMQTTDIYQAFYYRPWFRAPPFFIGMTMGFFKIENIKLNFSNRVIVVMIVSGVCIISYLTFGWYDTMQLGQDFYPEWLQYTYEAFMRFTYAIALTLVALPNVCGHSNWFYRMFNNSLVRQCVQFTFSAYLIHYLIALVVSSQFYESSDFNIETVLQFNIGILFFTIPAAISMRIFIEIPLMQLIQMKYSMKDYKKL